ncbi:ABC transporter substrate-binding protein [Undibacter mobilis]|uniref:ABC transporter permease n=1 Tax=Undibacter mobilis TaxID=2292256 RepID=A0A371B449_9BRAD|nr:ABC transporter substrate-binding protein [Undibacter mobilis]RDV02213.1 ABC transporter permease [Undibacter mobilis]
MKKTIGLATLAALLLGGTAYAQQINVKVGVLTDMSSLYADDTGIGSVIGAKLAAEDFMKTNPNVKVEVVSADHQNKADVGSNIANQWYDRDGVDMIADVPNSGVALAIAEVTKNKNKVFVGSGPASSDLTGPKCSPNTIHWTYDTWMLANGTGKAMVKTGGDTWFFLTSDYAFGHALERDTAAVVEASGGKVLGKVRHPINTNDFSSFLLQAQASKAKVIGLANAGGDTINAIKQGAEFGIVAGGQKFAGLLIFAPDVAALGLKTAQGLTFTETWYWDLNEDTRAWTKRWDKERNSPGKLPSMNMAGVYSGTLHYLKAVAAVGSAKDGKAVADKMKQLPAEDTIYGKSVVREDGRVLHPAYLFEVKKPEESKYAGDLYHLRATIPMEEAFRPLKDGNCPLVKG